MLTIASGAHRAHAPRTLDVEDGIEREPVEVPERVDRILGAIAQAGLGEVRAPEEFGPEPVLRVHTREYVEFLATAHAQWCAATGRPPTDEAIPYVRALRDQPLAEPPHVVAKLGWYSHDTDPLLAGTFAAATGAVDVALTAWDRVASGTVRTAYALCRPPGHHAAADSYGGYCYLNNAAVVAQAAADAGARVAVLDVDFHHGNGTQQIFYDRDDVLYVSLHGDPARHYPYFLGFADERGWGAGEGCNRNFPLPPGTEWSGYSSALDAAVATVARFGPDVVVVSLGVDTALEEHDSFRLTGDDFVRVGAAVRGLDRPIVAVQEGGYVLDVVGRNVVNVLRGLEG
jgi:acetoin utilization deacetylase AcuC-like enzyme